ncbi:MAG TPA: hypothetical protein VFL72_01235 [Acidimicrobiia bacterium]|nr:hypothetical protein [Acidimicrobiia bacterium]
MKFEELASRAGKTAATVGRCAEQPEFGQVLRDRRRRTIASGWTTAVVLLMAVIGVMLIWPTPVQELAPIAEPTTVPAVLADVPGSCPITLPEDDAFKPESELPEIPDPGLEAVPYGRPELWTLLGAQGEVWRDLPVGSDGSLTQMLYFWSENHVPGDGSEILVFGENLEGSPYGIRARGGAGSDPSRGDYLAVVFDIPEPGCWRISAVYRATGIDYVVWVDGD